MNTETTQTLSPQEQAIENGKSVTHGAVTDRVMRLYEAVRAYGQPRASVDRAALFTESFKETEGQPTVWRWAKALKHYAENSPLAIFPDELIVGRPATWLGRYAIVYPELDGSVMPMAVEVFRKAKGKPNEVVITEEDAKIIRDVLTPYWAGKDFATGLAQEMPEDIRFLLFGPDKKNIIIPTMVMMTSSTMRHSQNWTVDYKKLLARGVKGIREEAQAKLAALTEPKDLVTKKPFLEAVIMTCDAMTTLGQALCQSRHRAGRQGTGSPAEERAAGDRRDLRHGCRRTRRARSAKRSRPSGSGRPSPASR